MSQVDQPSSRPTFDVRASKNNAFESRMDEGTCAHGAGFFCDVEIAVCEAPVADLGLVLGRDAFQ